MFLKKNRFVHCKNKKYGGSFSSEGGMGGVLKSAASVVILE